MMKLRKTEIGLPAGEVWLDGLLAHAPDVRGLVLIAERSGRKLRESRDAYVAQVLHRYGFGTLQFGLLAHGEGQRSPDNWFRVPLLTARILAILEWVNHQPQLEDQTIGLMATDSAAAAMIRVALKHDVPLRALVCRSGRPDLAGLQSLRELRVPLLMVCGGKDEVNTEQNADVNSLLEEASVAEFVVVPEATKSFAEPGTLAVASEQIARWFSRWLCEEPSAESQQDAQERGPG